MIGRTQEKGYAIVELTFSDTASIPAYATYYIQTMAGPGRHQRLCGRARSSPEPTSPGAQMAKILYNLM